MLETQTFLANTSKNTLNESMIQVNSNQQNSICEKNTIHSPQTTRNKQKAAKSPSKLNKRKDKHAKLDKSIVKLTIEERYPSEDSESDSSSDTGDELIFNSLMNALKNKPSRTKKRINTRANTSLAIPKVENLVAVKEPNGSPSKRQINRTMRKRSLVNFSVKSIENLDATPNVEPLNIQSKSLKFNDYIFTSEHNRLGLSTHASYTIKQGEYTLFRAKQKDRNIQVNSPIFISSGTKSQQTPSKHVGIFMAFNKTTEFALSDIHDNVQYSSEQIKANIQKDQLSLSLSLHTPRDKLEIQGNYSSNQPSDSNRTVSFVNKASNIEYITLTYVSDTTWSIRAIDDIDPKQLLSLAIVIDHFSRIAKKNSAFA